MEDRNVPTIVFEERAVGMPLRAGRARRIAARVVALLVVLAIAALAFQALVKREGRDPKEGLGSGQMGSGQMGSGQMGSGGDDVAYETGQSSCGSTAESGSASDDITEEESLSHSDGENDGVGEADDVGGNGDAADGGAEKIMAHDLSRSEWGDHYIINCSGRAVDAEGALAMGFRGASYSFSERPEVMIIHSITSASYADRDRDDPLHSVTRSTLAVGQRLAEELNSRGIAAVHVTAIHDGGDEAYAESAKTVKSMLEIYPDVKYVVDLGVMDITDDEGRRIKTLSANGCAQVRLTVSTQGRSWRDELSLSLCLRRELNKEGKKLCMPVVLSDSRYCAGYSRYYLKADFGSSVNTTEEAMELAMYFAEAFEGCVKRQKGA